MHEKRDREYRIHASQWDDDEPMEFSLQDSEGDGDVRQVPTGTEDTGQGETQRESTEFRSGFTVREIEQFDDGSAQFEVDASKEEMQNLFQVCITQALVNGARSMHEYNEAWTAERDALTQADLLVRMLDVWEMADTFDYTPNIEDQKEKLKALLKKAGV